MRRLLPLLVGVALFGCDGVRSIGDGNEALLVRAEASFNGDDTQVRVEVFRNGQRLDDNNAQVQIAIGEDGAAQATQFQGNRFEINLNGYTQELRLFVNSGGDNVDAVFNGPDIAVIESPTAGQTVNVSQGEDLEISWSADDGGATQVRVSTQGFSTTLLNDPGNFTIPFFNVDTGADEVTIERTNFSLLDGGADGSTFSISAESNINFNAE
jgi:hypothetical protein